MPRIQRAESKDIDFVGLRRKQYEQEMVNRLQAERIEQLREALRVQLDNNESRR